MRPSAPTSSGCGVSESAPLPSEMAPATGRDVAALLDPRPACVVGACHQGRIGFATVIWATPVSHSPALVAFALREGSHTMGLLRAAGRFSVAVPLAGEGGVRLVEACGDQSGHAVDKGALVPHELVDGVPVPHGACAWEACAVRSVQQAGDHLLVIGEVEQAATSCQQRDERGRLLPTEALLCVQHGAYGRCEPLAER